MQRLAYIVNWPLHTTVNLYQHQAHGIGSHSNVGKQNLIHLGSGHNRWPKKVLLKLLESQDTLLGPFKSLPLIQQV